MTFIPSSGGGGSIYPGYAPPSSPNALDDEFDSLGLDGSWTVWDEGSNFTVSPEVLVANQGLRMSCDDPGTAEMQGIFKAAPTGDFTLWGRFSTSSENQNLSLIGLMIAEDLATSPATANIAVAGLLSDRHLGPKADRNTWSAYNARGFGGSGPPIGSSAWIRLRYDSTLNQFNCEWSSDGLTWFNAVNGGSVGSGLTGDPASIGIWCSNDSAIDPYIAYAKHFRVTSSAAFDQVLPSADYE